MSEQADTPKRAILRPAAAEAVKKLADENDKLRAELQAERKKSYDLMQRVVNLTMQMNSSDSMIKSLQTTLVEKDKAVMHLRTEVAHWKKCVRIEQAIKRTDKYQRRIRHLPTPGFIARTKFDAPATGHVNLESIYLNEWRDENRNSPLLQWMMENVPESDPCGPPRPITQRDACVAATVITWLGTNVGQGFLHQCECIAREKRDNLIQREYKAVQQWERTKDGKVRVTGNSRIYKDDLIEKLKRAHVVKVDPVDIAKLIRTKPFASQPYNGNEMTKEQRRLAWEMAKRLGVPEDLIEKQYGRKE